MRVNRRQALGAIGGAAAALSVGTPARAAGLRRIGAPFEAVPSAEGAFSGGVAALPDGGFLIGWNGDNADGLQKNLRGRVWNPNGERRGGTRDYVVPKNFGDQDSFECAGPIAFKRSSLLALNGRVFREGEFLDRINVLVLSDAETRRGDPIPISGDAASATALAACKLSNDRAIVAWNTASPNFGANDVAFRIVGADGRPIGKVRKIARSSDPERVNALHLAVALPDGGAIILLGRVKTSLTGVPDKGLFAQRLNAEGETVGKPFRIDRQFVFLGEPLRPRGVGAVGLPGGAWALLFYGSGFDKVSWIVFDAEDRPGPRRDVTLDTRSVVFDRVPGAVATKDGRLVILVSCTDFTASDVEFDKLKAVLVEQNGRRIGPPLELARFRDPNDGYTYEAFIVGAARLENKTFVASWGALRPRDDSSLSACRFAID